MAATTNAAAGGGARESILHKVRTALGRSPGQPPAPVPPALSKIPSLTVEERIAAFSTALEKLNGKAYVASSQEDARRYTESLLAAGAGLRAVASNAPFLAECGILSLSGVESGFSDRVKLREACIHLDLGITSADYALAETGTLVMISSAEEARMISLLPPKHLAIVPRERLLTSLDEFYRLAPVPSSLSSAVVLITGPSRTADIEQILVRGVHGPGEIHVVIV